MPDCLEMPYQPNVTGAESLPDDVFSDESYSNIPYIYRLGGNSCLSGDFMGAWRFDHELKIGETVFLRI